MTNPETRSEDRTSPTPGAGPWLVMREARQPRWGGEIRRHHVFKRLAEQTSARVIEDGWYPALVRRAVLGPVVGRLPLMLGVRFRGSGPRARLAASEKLRERTLESVKALADPAVVAIYDDPMAQSMSLGVRTKTDWLEMLDRRHRANREAFRWLVAPTASFAALAGLDQDRLIVGGNGTDTSRVAPGPWPDGPVVGVVSGAAPGRGLELLVAAARLARERIPELVLRMWLVATGDESRRYLDGLRAETRAEPWVEIATAPYDRLGEALSRVSVLTIPHPPGEYMDVALPVKLFDSLAAGRPLVVTPRSETRRVVERHGVGLVARGDAPADVAEAIVELLADEPRLRDLGARARDVAEREFDWRVVGDRIATEVLRREGGRD